MDSAEAHAPTGSCQAKFARRWGHLTEPHVRALAWLVDSPGLLDPADPAWAGKLAPPLAGTPALHAWFARLDAAPAPLLEALGPRPHTRLGLYAEKLLAYFYRAHGRLVAHGLQVRASRNDTVGEFDFLLAAQDGAAGLEHIELATKFYLLAGAPAAHLDGLVGPNLADTLGKKMRKIFEQQLALAAHPAAQAALPAAVLHAHALIKGWLFYPLAAPLAPAAPLAGIAPDHCRGFWCTAADVPPLAERWVVLPRLQWLAPYRWDGVQQLFDGAGLRALVAATFEQQRAPLMVAALTGAEDGALVEAQRGFVVPDDWPGRAAQGGASGRGERPG